VKIDLNHFFPDEGKPLLVSFSNFLHEHDVTTQIQFDFWDLYGYNGDENPLYAVVSLKNRIHGLDFKRLTQAVAPLRVVLLEGDDIWAPRLESNRTFLASIGVGLYARGVGWVCLPGNPLVPATEDWNFKLLDRYSRDETGQWVKACTKCGEVKPTSGYYRRPRSQPRARDPFRNVCKTCFEGYYKKRA
jgi:hypothetical protein